MQLFNLYNYKCIFYYIFSLQPHVPVRLPCFDFISVVEFKTHKKYIKKPVKVEKLFLYFNKTNS